jgi:hypothetical protein
MDDLFQSFAAGTMIGAPSRAMAGAAMRGANRIPARQMAIVNPKAIPMPTDVPQLAHEATAKTTPPIPANLRVLEVDEIKAIPCTPRSHAFVERLIGTVRREYLDRTLFWNQSDLERKLENYKTCYDLHRCHSGLAGATPAERSACPHRQSQNLTHIPGGNIATAYFRPQMPPELEFDTDR